MRRRRNSGPIRSDGDGFVIDIGAEESELIRRLLGDLRAILSEDAPDSGARLLLVRLFPVVYADDPEAEAEYQRLMREELVESKLAAMQLVDDALGGDGRVDEGRLIAFMQSINSIRLVLGTMLGVSDDPAEDEVTPGLEGSAEYHLYADLSWLLEHTVQALSRA